MKIMWYDWKPQNSFWMVRLFSQPITVFSVAFLNTICFLKDIWRYLEIITPSVSSVGSCCSHSVQNSAAGLQSSEGNCSFLPTSHSQTRHSDPTIAPLYLWIFSRPTALLCSGSTLKSLIRLHWRIICCKLKLTFYGDITTTSSTYSWLICLKKTT